MVTIQAWRGIVVVMLLFLLAFPSTTLAGGQAVTLQPRQVVAQYFADLGSHRYYQAYLLEATCTRVVYISYGPGVPPGSSYFRGREKWSPQDAQAWRSFLPAVHVTGIGRFHRPLLDKGHILGFLVRGYFTFHYLPWANYQHKSGFHVVKIAVWRCGGHWGVDPEWAFGSSGDLAWP